ncbi:MAG: peptide chain release factor N(5)-glutamine methyltransferase [Pyrinomonadaceae bacterium]
MNIATAISSAAEILQNAKIPECRREASSLMAFILQRNAAFVIAHSDDELAANQKMLFESCVRRRARHEPFQYITRRQEFYGLEFEVTPDVLIPRPETEILVEQTVEVLSRLENPRFCEIGVGSGCISVSILHSVETASGVGADISESALNVARSNALKHEVDKRLNLQQSDLFSQVSGLYDLIVSNPPYVPREQIDSLQAEVRDFEPSIALDGGEDGLSIIEEIIRTSPEFLNNKGFLLLEIGFDQAMKVEKLFDRRIWKEPKFLADLQGIPRVVKVMKEDS